MKKLLLIICMYSVFPAVAQLNGTYTIGGAAPDYATFTDAITALTTFGISSPILFNVRNGTYSGKIVIPEITGTSDINRITFQSEAGDSSAVILTDTSLPLSTDNYTVWLNGADYITFKKLTISRTGIDAYATVINISNNATHNEFLNNYITGPSGPFSNGSSVNRTLVLSPALTFNDSMNIFTGNLFENGSNAIYYYGPDTRVHESGTVITNNIFKNQSSSVLYISYQDGIVISGNEIITTANPSSSFYGMFLNFFGKGMTVSGNKIYTSKGTGMYMSNCEGDLLTPVHIANNFISVKGSSAYGINIDGGLNINLYNNSVRVEDASSVCLYSAAVLGKVNIENNIFFNTGKCVTILTTENIANSDYNDFYSAGSTMGYWDSVDVVSLSDWQTLTGGDAHSVAVDPMFVSANDLHANSPVINNAGVAIVSITVDIDGEARSSTTPDIGADEFTPGTIGTAAIMYSKLSALIYPNPAGEQLNVEFPGTGERSVVARLIDINGRVVSEQKFINENTIQKTTFDLHTTEEGIYILQLISKTDVSATKVTILHH